MKISPYSTKAWVWAFRPFSYTASMIPVLLGAVLTVYLNETARWWLLPLWSLLTLLTVPAAFRNIKTALKSRIDNPQEIAMLDVQTAQLHMPFGLLLITSIALGGVL